MSLSPKTQRFFILAWAVVKGFFWPVLGAVAIVAYGFWAPWLPSEKLREAVKAFFAILLFIMFFFGQYKRVEKQTEDKDSFQFVNEQLLSLQELVRKIRPAQPEVAAVPHVAVGEAGTLLDESRALLSSGHALAALLQGGVAFEHAVRSFARDYKDEKIEGVPLHELIKRMALVLPKEMIGELHALRVIRNRLTHVSKYELADLPDAERILTGYEWAVSELARMGQRPSAT